MTEEAVPSLKSKKKTALTPVFCEIEGCTWEYKIQRHRIIPGRDGGKYKAHNVIALCPNHHFLADNGILSTEELQEIVRLRYENGWPPLVESDQEQQDTTERIAGVEVGGSSSAEESSTSDGVGPPDAADGAAAGSSNQ